MISPSWKTFIPGEIPLGELHSLMLAAIGPRPISFVSTVDREGRPNLAPFSFFNAFGSNPATLIFSPARRGRDNTTKHTLENVEVVPECVVNVVNFSMVEQVSLASTDFDEGVNEFEKAGFTPLKSEHVRPFRVAESPASFECKVEQIIKTGDQGGAGNLVICRILAIHYNEKMFKENGLVDQVAMDLVGRMGYEYYVRANAGSIFELPKPRTKQILGFDGLPQGIREADFLTGNELARFANLRAIPTPEILNAFKSENNLGGFSMEDLRNEGFKHLSNKEIELAFYCFLLADKPSFSNLT